LTLAEEVVNEVTELANNKSSKDPEALEALTGPTDQLPVEVFKEALEPVKVLVVPGAPAIAVVAEARAAAIVMTIGATLPLRLDAALNKLEDLNFMGFGTTGFWIFESLCDFENQWVFRDW